VGTEWLAKIIFGTYQTPFELIDHPIMAREHNNDGVAELGFAFEAASNLVAIHFGQTNIKNNQVWYRPCGLRKPMYGFYTIREAPNFKTFAAKAILYDVPHRAGIIDNQDELAHKISSFSHPIGPPIVPNIAAIHKRKLEKIQGLPKVLSVRLTNFDNEHKDVLIRE
jgi:hypothetical protein